MLARVLPLEEGKDLLPRAQHKPFPLRIIKIFLLFLSLGVVISVLSVYTTRYFDVKNVILQPRLGLIQQCFTEENEFKRWIKPPSSSKHSMNDEELFWRASFVPQLKKYPHKRVPKVAFMFLTRGPLPLSPLWERFFEGHEEYYSIYIHSLPNYKDEFKSGSVFYQRQVPSQVAEWGKMSMCDAERRLLANALLDLSNERFVLVSESCIPLHNFSIIYQYLIKSRTSFVGSFDDPTPHGRGRYNSRMYPEVTLAQWRKGAQWFEVNRELAVKLVSDTKYYPKFKDYCRPACYVDEHYFPTMLSIETPNLIANRTVTYVDWSRGGAHPATFGKGDITEAFLKRIIEGQKCLYNGQPSSLCFLFARKFAPSALEPLLNITNTLLGFS
ncbi:uncharacterized protein A4U43_C03F7990 [Asparagus officinalis]|uniref:Core-2/I-branching beta-1,6-N-acetylglucosaminyltransferase family protein n=1 Tax=Asparagus officinalis TaxID=4686 RepID=A0A5P1F8Z6_ASPOF|nr:uncharacterized protein LOC109833209 [Asparagus officinalis]XP_020256392.1 uncharacterized protein LOC109833209 [Asparagus officinalis]ONK74584.1 uncharacterized protein A4U43_C03F7990 [Asparagus officinalis]